MSTGDAYEVLGVPPTADDAEIRRAFRRLARKYHPDLSADGKGSDRFRTVRRAYEELIDRDARAKLDDRRLSRPDARAARGAPEARGAGRRFSERLADLIENAVYALRLGSPHLWDWIGEGEERFEGRLTGSRRFELDAVLTRDEADSGLVIPFRFQVGSRLVSEDVAIPRGVRRGDEIRYVIPVASGIDLDLLVHIDIA